MNRNIEGVSLLKKIVVRIHKNGKIEMETLGMHGKECRPYVNQVADALNAMLLAEPEWKYEESTMSGAAADIDEAFYEEEERKLYL